MSAPALSLSFFDPEHGLHASARAGTTIVFEGGSSRVLADGPRIEAGGGGWRAELDGAFELELQPVAEPARLAGATIHVCEARGRAAGKKVRCLGTVSETAEPPAWAELDALRAVSAIFDADNAFLAIASRPRGAAGHGDERVAAWLLVDGEPTTVEDGRISTVYDGGGRQRSAGLELWLPGQEFPTRGSGTVVAGASLKLEGLEVHAAIFRWRMEDREGAGSYELWLRDEPAAA